MRLTGSRQHSCYGRDLINVSALSDNLLQNAAGPPLILPVLRR